MEKHSFAAELYKELQKPNAKKGCPYEINQFKLSTFSNSWNVGYFNMIKLIW